MNPGTKEIVVPPPDIQIHVKGLSLGVELEDKDSRSSLRLSYEFAASHTSDDEDDEENEGGKEATTVTKEIILGSLTPGKVGHVLRSLHNDVTIPSLFQIEQAAVDLILDEEDEYVFEVIGKK